MNFNRSISDWRFYIFLSLVVTAPLSKYPSISVPLFNFPSFRIGLYQLLVITFVILCLRPIYLAGIRFFAQQHRLTFIALTLLAILAASSIAWSLYPARSALLAGSIISLIALALSSWWFVALDLTNQRRKILLHTVLYAGIFFGFIAIIQLIVFTLTQQTFGILCAGCSADIFGFPRVNGLAAEPLFFANAMIPYVFAAVYAVISQPSKLAWSAVVLSTMAIGLTFSRGAYLAVAIALLVTFVTMYTKQYVSAKIALRIFGVIIISGIASLGLLVAAATIRYNTTKNITYETIDSIAEHLTNGVIDLPETVNTAEQTSNSQNTSTQEQFESPGLIEASSQERLSAANLAINAWQYNPFTVIFGVGVGNLGPFVVQNIESTAPDNLTVYIYYILLLSELGIIGFVTFVIAFVGAIWRLVQRASVISLIIAGGLFAFLIQFMFFGSYINVMYIWLWLGISLGFTSVIKKPKHRTNKV